jgi:hypothetical protein
MKAGKVVRTQPGPPVVGSACAAGRTALLDEEPTGRNVDARRNGTAVHLPM